MRIILASASPRRKQLLSDAGLDFEIMVAATDESYPKDLAIELVPEYIAKEKAIAVLQQLGTPTPEDSLIIAADTVVVLDDEIIGKPEGATHAKKILQQLSGRTHRVITGVHLARNGVHRHFSSTTEVRFNPLSEQQIDYYITNYKPFDKAGAYAIQEWIGLVGVSSISGDIYNVIGLPVNKLLQQIEDWQ